MHRSLAKRYLDRYKMLKKSLKNYGFLSMAYFLLENAEFFAFFAHSSTELGQEKYRDNFLFVVTEMFIYCLDELFPGFAQEDFENHYVKQHSGGQNEIIYSDFSIQFVLSKIGQVNVTLKNGSQEFTLVLNSTEHPYNVMGDLVENFVSRLE